MSILLIVSTIFFRKGNEKEKEKKIYLYIYEIMHIVLNIIT